MEATRLSLPDRALHAGTIISLMRRGRDTLSIAQLYWVSEADIWNILAKGDREAVTVPSIQEVRL